jgi:hypothetical protein
LKSVLLLLVGDGFRRASFFYFLFWVVLFYV